MSDLPLSTDLPPDALRVLALAQRHETPCGDGRMVWHAWGQGEPLVLLHGGSGSWTHWLRNVQALAAAGRRVLVPDLPGFGDSAVPPGNQDADGVVAPLADGLRALLGDAPCDVTGFSFGGLTAGLLAGQHPGRVRRLVLVGAPGMGLRNRRLPLTPWRHLEDAQARNAVHRSNLATLMLNARGAIDDTAVALQAANVPRDRMRGRHLALSDILARTLPTLDCPVDAIYGEQDALYRGRLDELEAVLRTAPAFGRLLLLPGAGHWVQYEAADAFHQALLGLLAGR
jgi:2-hydroxy-6-oxonona-2,4-dienedioate hydrolase